MKSRLSLAMVLGLLIGFVVLLFMRNAKQGEAEKLSVQEIEVQQPVPQRSQTRPSKTSDSIIPGYDRANDEKMVADYVEEQNQPIQFYGKVVDQAGEPVPGAKILVKVRQWFAVPAALTGRGQSIPVQTETDANGQFEIQGVKGDGFHFEYFSKENYRLSPKTYMHSGPVNGTPADPVVYKMWKMGEQQTLISGQKVFGIIPDGRTYTLDLLEGKKLEGIAEGDLRVTIKRPEGVQRKQKYEWSFLIEGIKGGVIETKDEFMYIAPDSGYQTQFELNLIPADPAWTSLVKRRFFLRSRDGQVYGSIEVEVNAIYNDKSAIEVNYSLNPSGLKNLQP